MSAGVFLAVGIGLFVALMFYLALRDDSLDPDPDPERVEPEAKSLSNGGQPLFYGWEVADYIAPVDMKTRVVDGKECPESALDRFGEYAEKLYTGQAYAPSLDLREFGIPAILYIFPTFLVYHGDPEDISYSNFMVFSPPSRASFEATLEMDEISLLLEKDPRHVVAELCTLIQVSSDSLHAFAKKKYDKAYDEDKVSDKDMDDILHGMMERSSKWESKGSEIAQDCLYNGLLKGEIVRLSEITNAIRQRYSYNANVVEHGFLTKMMSYIDQGSVINIKAEGGDMVFVHKNHADEILGKS